MKYIVIGLGNFGSTLASRLTTFGHEVFGVDNSLEKAEQFKDRITHTICLDTSKPNAMKNLPIRDTDIVVVAIGEDVGASILTTALLKQNNARQIIGRAINPLHRTVLESIGIETIFNPEELAAEMIAKQLEMQGVLESFDLADDSTILEIKVPERYLGRNAGDLDFEETYGLRLLGIKRFVEEKRIFGLAKKRSTFERNVNEEHIFDTNDILVMMGDMKNFQKMIGKD